MNGYPESESILPHILAAKQESLARQKRKPDAFEELFRQKDFVFITEVKPRSPSAGVLYSGSPSELVTAYEKGGADAISVLTEEAYFGGSTQMFEAIRAQTPLPLLRKDFVIDEYQIAESVVLGADAVLLIAGLLDPPTLARFVRLADDFGITSVVEIYDTSEVSKVINAGASIIGVNARNLQTFSVDIPHAVEVLLSLPEHIVPLALSGIQSVDDVRRFRNAGARGVLMGTTLLRAGNPEEMLRKLREEPL